MTRSAPFDPASRLAEAVTHRGVLALALPMTLSHITTPLLGFVGAVVVGRLGNPALLGAMALGAIVFDFIFWTFGSLRMATAGLTAQAVGAGTLEEVDRALARAMVAAALVGVALILLQGPIAAAALALSGASPAVTRALSVYIHIRILAAPFTLANYAIMGSTLGRGRSDLGLLFQVAINLLNMGLTIVFVLVLGLGVAGAALATVIAEAAGVALGLCTLARIGTRPWRVPRGAIIERAAMLRMIALNRDVMIRTAALASAFALFAALGARDGDVTLAANAVLQNMFLIGGYVLDGFATAAETLCGQAVGAREEGLFRRAAGLSLRWCLGFGAFLTCVFFLIGSSFIAAITTSPEVRDLAARFLPFAAVSPLVGAAAFAFDGIFIGAMWTGAMRNLMLVALAAYLSVIVGIRDLGNAGLWIAFLSFLTARGVGQALVYPRLARRTFGLAAPKPA